jgi:hypothetical protein
MDEREGEGARTPTPRQRPRRLSPVRDDLYSTRLSRTKHVLGTHPEFDTVCTSFRSFNYADKNMNYEWVTRARQLLSAILDGINHIPDRENVPYDEHWPSQAKVEVMGMITGLGGELGLNLDVAECETCEDFHNENHPPFAHDRIEDLEQEVLTLKSQLATERGKAHQGRSGQGGEPEWKSAMAEVLASVRTMAQTVDSRFSKLDTKIQGIQQTFRSTQPSNAQSAPTANTETGPQPQATKSQQQRQAPPHAGESNPQKKSSFAETAASGRTEGASNGTEDWTEVEGKRKRGSGGNSPQSGGSLPKPAKALPAFTKVIVRFTGQVPTAEQLPAAFTMQRCLARRFSEMDSAKAGGLDLILGAERSSNGNVVLTWPGRVKHASIMTHSEVITPIVSPEFASVFQTDEHWSKIVISNVPGYDDLGDAFSPEQLMQALKNNDFFRNTVITWPPRWMVSPGLPPPIRGSLTVGVVDGDHAIYRRLERGSIPLFIAGMKAFGRNYKERGTFMQCHKCWKDEPRHMATECNQTKPTCRLCKGAHKEADHKSKCPCVRNDLSASCVCPPKCANCDGDHYADDVFCPRRKKYKPAKPAHTPESNPRADHASQPSAQEGEQPTATAGHQGDANMA